MYTHFFYYYYIGFPIAFVDLRLIQILSYIMDLPTRLVGLQQKELVVLKYICFRLVTFCMCMSKRLRGVIKGTTK
jgi:hypothetical protein